MLSFWNDECIERKIGLTNRQQYNGTRSCAQWMNKTIREWKCSKYFHLYRRPGEFRNEKRKNKSHSLIKVDPTPRTFRFGVLLQNNRYSNPRSKNSLHWSFIQDINQYDLFTNERFESHSCTLMTLFICNSWQQLLYIEIFWSST